MPAKRRAVPDRRDAWPIHLELSEPDYLVLLKSAARGSGVLTRLVAAEASALTANPRYRFRGSAAHALALRAIALAHAPKAVAAIDRALKQGKT